MTDLARTYSTVLIEPEELHMQRLVWRWGKLEDEWQTYGLTKMCIGDGAELCGLMVVRDPDAEGGADNNPEAGEVTEPAGRSSPTPRLNFHLRAREMAELGMPELFLEEGVEESKLTPEGLMKEAQEVVDHYKDVEKFKTAISNLLQADSAGFVKDEDVLVENFEAASAFQDAMLQVWWSRWKAQHFPHLLPYH